MPTPLPILPPILEPCNQSWEAMPGTARIRHCAACNQDVVNTAALSAAEITELLRGPLPCLRIARYDDGTLVTAEPPAAAQPRPRLAASLLAAAMALGSGAAAQDSRRQNALLGAPPVAPQAQLDGQVTDLGGHPLAAATVTLLQNGTVIATAPLHPDGKYTLSAPAGRYDLHVEAPNAAPQTVPVQLTPSKPLVQPMKVKQYPVLLGRISPPPTVGKPPAPTPQTKSVHHK